MKKKEKIEKTKIVDEEDEIKFLKKYKGLDVSNKILICLYILIGLTIINMVLPYAVVYFQNKVASNNNDYDTSMFNTVTGTSIKNIATGEKAEILFICSENYQECRDFISVVQKAQTDYNYVTNYLAADELNNEDYANDLLEYDNDKGFINDSLGQVPIVLVLKEGKLVEGWVGVSTYDNFKDFLKHAKIIK